MFCEKCGSELKENARFCEKCGTPVTMAEEQTTAQAATEEQATTQEEQATTPEKQAEAPKTTETAAGAGKAANPLSGMPKKNLGIIGGAAVVVVLLLVLIFGRGKTINLTPYVSVEFSGVENYGSADCNFDEDAFRDKYEGKLKVRNSKEVRELKQMMGSDFDIDEYAMDYMLEYCISPKVTPEKGLKNGDTVTLTWNVDEDEIKDIFGCKVKAKEQTYTVSDLEEVKTEDIFANIDLVYTGTAPYGTVSIVTNKNTGIASNVGFSADKYDNLSNGDVITITANPYSNEDDFMEECAEQYGAVPETLEKEYTVEGLPSYVTKIEEIPEDMMDKMKAQAEDVFNADAADWKDGASVESVTYIGSYMMTQKKENSYWGDRTKIYLVYNIGAMEKNDEMGVENHFNYYYTVEFPNITILPDGTSTMDLTSYTVPYGSFKRDVEWDTGWWDYYYMYTGYETLDNLFNDCVGKYVDEYNYESTVEDVSSDDAQAEDSQEESATEEETTEE